MIQLECDHIPEKYPQILRHVIDNGRRVEPRGKETLELSPFCVSALSPRKRLFGTPGRNENPIFPYIEGLWILSGNDSPEMLSHYVRQTLCYVNPVTGLLDGAYGPRVKQKLGPDQFEAVYEKLRRDPDSRRAVIAIFDPSVDNNEESLDIPCAICWQFMIRENKLDMITYMRSNDLFRGFIYDTVVFQWFQEILAGWLKVDVGTYVHIAGSAHLYMKDKTKAQFIVQKYLEGLEHPSLYEYCAPQDARLPKDEFEAEFHNLLRIEERSRNGNLLDGNAIAQLLVTFETPFYRNLALAIAGYNALKFEMGELSSKIFSHIDNELGPLMWRSVAHRTRPTNPHLVSNITTPRAS